MKSQHDSLVTGELISKYYSLNKKKKEIELELNTLKDIFNLYFDHQEGTNDKGEVIIAGFKLQRQIRKNEKYNDEVTIRRLEELKLNDLIKIIKKPDDLKIKSALHLGLLSEKDLDGCVITTVTPAIYVKPVTPR